jgi:predicted permease
MAVIAQRLEREYPQENAQTGVTVSTLRDEASRQSRLLLAALCGASICVLLIACANLASLLLARALARRGELTVRAALGAGRERLARQLVTESLVLAVMGGVLGVLLAALAVPLLAVLAPTYLPVGEATALDRRVLGFAALVTGLTGLGFGVFPALRLGRDTDIGGLREGARGGLGGPRERLRAALVGAEVTAAVVLLISCGLLIRALWRVQATDPGFRTEGVLAVQTPVSMPKYASTTRRVGLYSEVLSGVRALPGVDGAAYISFLPMVMGGGIWPVQVEGAPRESSGQRAASLRFVTPDFFRTMGIPLRAGRDVRESDTADAPFVAVVSESFGRRYWPGQDPLGRRFNFGLADRIVVGVVGDIRVRGLERESEPQVYLAYKQVPDGSIWFYVPKELVIRSTSDAAPLAAAVRRIVRKADPELPIGGVRTLQEVVDADTAPRQTQLRLLGAFAALALLLAGIGIHGLLSFAVSQRRPEFGLRRALGARSGDILRMVLREGIVLAAAGSALGVFLANAAGHAMEALLAGVPPGDTLTLLAAATVALLMTVSGSLVPAIRAVRVDPTTALRVE